MTTITEILSVLVLIFAIGAIVLSLMTFIASWFE